MAASVVCFWTVELAKRSLASSASPPASKKTAAEAPSSKIGGEVLSAARLHLNILCSSTESKFACVAGVAAMG